MSRATAFDIYFKNFKTRHRPGCAHLTSFSMHSGPLRHVKATVAFPAHGFSRRTSSTRLASAVFHRRPPVAFLPAAPRSQTLRVSSFSLPP